MTKFLTSLLCCILLISCNKNKLAQNKILMEQEVNLGKEQEGVFVDEVNNVIDEKNIVTKEIDEKYHKYMETGDLSFLEGKYIFAYARFVYARESYYDFSANKNEYIEIKKNENGEGYILEWARSKNFIYFSDIPERRYDEIELLTGKMKQTDHLDHIYLEKLDGDTESEINWFYITVGLNKARGVEFIEIVVNDVVEIWGFFYRESDIAKYDKVSLPLSGE